MHGAFFFDPEDRIYDDHFPGHPVVPGSIIIHAFVLAADKMGLTNRSRVVKNFRFRRFISPGEYAYRVELAGDAELKCTLYDNHAVVATGTLRG